MGYQQEKNVVSNKQMSVAEAAYIAGLIDGEGSVGFAARGRKTHSLNVFVTISNTNVTMLHYVIEACGNGAIWKQNRRPGRKQCFRWSLTANQVRHVLPQLLPYLRIKRRQAECALRYLELIRGTQGILPEDVAEALALRAEISDLNRRGVTDEEEAALAADEGFCSVEDCGQRRYREHDLCFQHWLQAREKPKGVCEECGGEFEVEALKEKRFCSQECQHRFWHREVVRPKIEVEHAQRPATPCPNCGAAVDRAGYAGKTFCDDHCREAFRWKERLAAKPEIAPRPCPVCGREFLPDAHGMRQAYCSPACRNKAYRERHAEPTPEVQRECRICGAPFTVPLRHPDKQYCSQRCIQRAYRARQSTP